MSSFYRTQQLRCAGNCMTEILGKTRPLNEEFTPQEERNFYQAALRDGWIEFNGTWWCSERCRAKPYVLRNLSNPYWGSVVIEGSPA